MKKFVFLFAAAAILADVKDTDTQGLLFTEDGVMKTMRNGVEVFRVDGRENRPYYQLKEDAIELTLAYITSCKAMIHSAGNGSVIWDSLRLLTRAFFLSASPMLSQQQGVGPVGPYGRLTEDFLTLVEREYRDHRELDYYARRLNRNAKYLSRHIKEETGQTATDWIDKCVILDAEAQLLSTKQSILEISESLGFSSQSFFGKYFKRVKGVSPKEYKAKN